MAKIIKSAQAAPGAILAYECGILGIAVAPVQDNESVYEESVPRLDPVAQAQAEAERRIQELYQEALRRGLEDGEAQFHTAMSGVLSALRVAAGKMETAREAFLSSLEPQVLGLVRAITERILHREAQLDPEVVAATVRAALKRLTDRERVTVVLNPADLDAIRERRLDLLAGIEGLGHVDFSGDESVTPGGCLVESDHVRVDARLDAQLEQIFSALVE